MKRKSKFNEKLMVAIDEVLRNTFGEAGPLIYSYLESQSVKREEIPERLEDFAECLRNFSAGGSVVGTMILSNLYSKLGLEFEQASDCYSFADHVTKLRNCFQR
jgi:hypothetical protein